MTRINIIGCGPGDRRLLTLEAEKAIRESDCLIGDKRLLAPFASLGKPVFYSGQAEEILDFADSLGPEEQAAVLLADDSGFYSLAKSLLEKVKERPHRKYEVITLCGISSLQYFCAKLQIPWQEVYPASLHGRDTNILGTVLTNKNVFVLTGGKQTPADICLFLCRHGLQELIVSVGENLSYEQEKITTDAAWILAGKEFAELSVMLIRNPRPFCPYRTPGLPDELFARGDVPLAKMEARTIALAKLQLRAGDIIYDIGSGTGSVAIEAALQIPDGIVYAIEKRTEALELIAINRERFETPNLIITPGEAPENIEALPKPDKVFIGGSGGNLKEILDAVYRKNPYSRVVINAVALETLNEAMHYYNSLSNYEVEIINISISKAKKTGNYHMMTAAQNPVYILTAVRQE